MAQLIPNYITKEAPPGERQIFASLQSQLRQKDWIVLHSLNLPRHIRQNAGEIDFLIMVPGKGILILEIKSHTSVQRENGNWRLGNDKPTRRSPFEQASNAMYSLKKDLGSNLTRGVPFTYAVAFTEVRFNEVAVEWEPWQVLDKLSMGASLVEDIENVLDQNRIKLVADLQNPERRGAVAWFDPKENQPTKERIGQIKDQIRPNFEIHVSAADLFRTRQDEYKRFLNEQFDALDTMENIQRTLLEGPAGTGKSLLAIETTRRAIHKGLKTVFLCFNTYLASFLYLEVSPLPENCFAGTIHRFANKLFESKQDFDNPSFWPDAIRKLQNASDYDYIVVDEVQDICSVGAHKFLAELIKLNPKAEVRLFGDFQYQNIQFGSFADRSLLLDLVPDLAPLTLRRNCRNRPGIGEIIRYTTGLENLYVGYRLPNTSDNFKLKQSNSPIPEHVFQEILRDLFKDFIPSSIAILGCTEEIDVRSLGREYSSFFTNSIREWQPNQTVGISTTVRKFKGMDAQAVILTNLPDDLDTSIFYSGISRAIEQLVLICPPHLLEKMTRKLVKTEST